jgi:hypothetical protein
MMLKKLGLSFILALTMLGLVGVIIFILTKYPLAVSGTLMFAALWWCAYKLVKSLGD